ncbi:MAG: hypothetical protein EBR88_00105 [Betaproteobacteria bacterium]|nr:hypothetical protein [Betaproteobacteria bacterium]
MKTVRIGIIVGGLALGLASFGRNYLPPSLPVPAPAPASILDGLSAADARAMRDFYAALADIVARDGKAAEPVCKTTYDLRNRHKQALQMAFGFTSIVGKYPGLGDKLDAYLLQHVGSLDVPLTPEVREAAAKAFAAIR